MKIVEEITMDQVEAQRPKMIWYSANTCWWTHRPEHICVLPEGRQGAGLACDPRGGMLMQTDNPGRFLRMARENPETYGRHGLRAFMAAHHLNCRVSDTNLSSTCYRTWDEYNDALDLADALGLPS